MKWVDCCVGILIFSNSEASSRYKTGGGKPRDDQGSNASASADGAANDKESPKNNGQSPKPQQTNEQQAERPAQEAASRPPAAPAKKADAESAPDRAAKPAVEVSKDDKGIYTLKPAETSPPAAKEHSAPPAPTGGNQ